MADEDKPGETVDYSRWQASSDDVRLSVKPKAASCKTLSTKVWVIIVVVCVLVSMVLGIVFGYMIRRRVHETITARSSQTRPLAAQISHQVYDHNVFEKVSQGINMENIESYIREYSSKGIQYPPGSDAVNASALEIEQFCADVGLMLKTAVSKKMLLSRPGLTASSFTVSDGLEVVYQANISSDEPETMRPYVAYSHSGVASGPPVFVNFGRLDDFLAPDDEYEGSICFVKLGKLNPYNIIVNANRFQCGGVVMYPDPYEYPFSGPDQLDTQLFLNAKELSGDPATPGIPSFSDSLYSLSDDAVQEQYFPPSTPALTASARMVQNALVDLRRINDNLTSEWTGLVPGIDYQAAGKSKSRTVEIKVNNRLEEGYAHEGICAIRGTVDTDKFIVITSHHDSLGTGKDPASGQAIMRELLATITKQTDIYKPRRSLMFLMTDGSSLDLGTRELIEEFMPELTNRVVAVVNLANTLISGSRLVVSVSPLLQSLVTDIAKNTTVKGVKINPVTGPYHYRSFNAVLAAPVVDASFINSTTEEEGIVPSLASLPRCCSKFDSDLSSTGEAVRFHLQLLMRLANEPIYPYDLAELSSLARSGMDSVLLKLTNRISLDAVKKFNSTVGTFSKTMKAFYGKIKSAKNLTLPEVSYRRINDAILGVRGSFLIEQGVPMIDAYNSSVTIRNLNNRNCLIGSLSDNNFDSIVYPGLMELLQRGDPASPAVNDMLFRHVTEVVLAFSRGLDYMKRGLVDSDVFKPRMNHTQCSS